MRTARLFLEDYRIVVLLEWLLKKENQSTLRIVSILMVFLPLAYTIGVGFHGAADYGGDFPTSQWVTAWFRSWFEALMMLSLFFGILLLIAAFSRRRNQGS
jgi:hypothetical protein